VTAFAAVSRMEWIKLRSLRSSWWIMGLFAVSMIGLAIVALSLQTPAHLSAQGLASYDPTEQSMEGLTFGVLLGGILGVLVITGEYSSGLIRATLAAVPRRPRVLAAKTAVVAAVMLAAGEVLAFAAFFAGEAALNSSLPHASLSQPGVARAVLMAGAFPCLMALIGLGLGALIRHTAGAIGTVVAVIFVLPLVVLPVPHGAGIEKFLPLEIGENSLTAVKPVADSLTPWAGLLMMCVYAAAALIAGGVALTRRDA
jgi:ABC-type transport system involved in multi-copper enzyme maturation permease subunit